MDNTNYASPLNGTYRDNELFYVQYLIKHMDNILYRW